MQDSFHNKLQQFFEDLRDEPIERLRAGPTNGDLVGST